MKCSGNPRWQVLVLAVFVDLFLGDPPNPVHPVAWMGAAIDRGRRRAPKEGAAAQFIYGLLLIIAGLSATWGTAQMLTRQVGRLPTIPRLVLEALLCKTTFSLRGLLKAGKAVYTPLQAGNCDQARRQLAWHLVSRDVSRLTPAQIAAATIESLAENLSDGMVAPLFYYTLGGLPAAAAYRFLNTADAMLGYRDREREWLGKATARFDDVANLLPARFTALLMLLGGGCSGQNIADGWRIWRRDAEQTASPNAGHPMSVAAGLLQVELEKVGHYRLGRGQRSPASGDILRAIGLIHISGLIAAGLASFLIYQRQKIRRH